MSTPTARYIITADDRSKAAIASVRKGFQDMERGVKASIKGVNSVLGVFVGVQLKQGFQQILRATAESAQGSRGFAKSLGEVREAAKGLLAAKDGLPEATRQMNALRDALKDPGLVAAADALTSTLISGFAKAAGGLAVLVAKMRTAGVESGVFTPSGKQEALTSLEGQIRRRREELAGIGMLSRDAIGGEGSILSGQAGDPAKVAQLQREIADLEMRMARLQAYTGPTGPGRRGAVNPYAIGIGVGGSSGSGGGSGMARGSGSNAWRMDPDLPGRLRDSNSMIAIDPKTLERSGQMWTDQFGDLEQVMKDIEKSMDDVSKTWGETTDTMSVYADEAARNMQGALADFLFDPFEDGLKGMARGFVDTLRRMAAEAAAAQVFGALFGTGGGKAGGGGSFAPGKTLLTEWMGGLLGGIFGGARAAGGPVAAGKAYLVGERGPELFAPGASGAIIPSGKMGGGMTLAPVYNIDARGATADLAQALPAILAENNRRMYDELDRRWGLR